jgi:hypothetical protein
MKVLLTNTNSTGAFRIERDVNIGGEACAVRNTGAVAYEAFKSCPEAGMSD